MKLYILVRDSIPIGHAINSAAHTSLLAHLKWGEDSLYQRWLNESFKKVTCKVSDEVFNKAKEFDHIVCTEDKLDNMEMAIAIHPMHCGNRFLKDLKLYS